MQTEAKLARIVDPILAEMTQEAETTQRLFDIIPEDKLDWRPHPKAKSLGELAMHIAMLPGNVAELSLAESVEPSDIPGDRKAATRAEIIEAFSESLKKAKDILNGVDDDKAVGQWQLTHEGKTVFAAPRFGFWRTVLLNHNYHHRGQLSTYLRTLDVPLPSIYGPSADTNPFA